MTKPPFLQPLDRRDWAFLLLAAFCFAAFATLWGPITTALVDPFHEGEYLSTRMLLEPGHTPPLMIHGNMDYVPANFAALIFGSDHLISGTRLMNLVFAQLAVFCFLGTLLTQARNRSQALILLLIGLLVLFWVDARAPTIVALQQGSPSTRDLSLMAGLWALMAADMTSSGRSDRLACLAGIIAGVGWAWAYNRGVILLVAIPVYALGAHLAGKSRRHLVWLLGGLAAGLGINAMAEGDVWFQHFRNTLYWQQHQSVWSGPVPLSLVARNLPFYLFGAAIGLAGVWAIQKCWRCKKRRTALPVLLVLGLAAGGNYLAIFNRPDPPHLMFALPWLTLLGSAAWLTLAPPTMADTWRSAFKKHAALLVVAVSVLIVDVSAATGSGTSRPVLQGLGRNTTTLLHGLPRDEAIVDPKIAKVAIALTAGGGRCTYVFDNSGAFYFLSGLKPCSSIMLPVYATAGNEAQIIADLEKTLPPLVVGRSNFWTDHIDDRSVVQRTPSLNAWFERNYEIERTIEGIEVRRRRVK